MAFSAIPGTAQPGSLVPGYGVVEPDGPDPTVTDVSPNSGASTGGTSVTITGTNFRSGALVYFVVSGTSYAATGVTVASGTEITCTTPSNGGAGQVLADVRVVNTDSTSGTLEDAYEYENVSTLTQVAVRSSTTRDALSEATQFIVRSRSGLSASSIVSQLAVRSRTLTTGEPEAGGLVLVVTIEGVVRKLQPGWNIASLINGRDVLNADIYSADGSYRPAIDDEIILVEGFSTSGTSNTIGTGAKTFTVDAGLYINTGERLRIYSTDTVTTWMEGTVTSYSGTTLVLNIETVNGSGTLDDWQVGRRIFGGEIQTIRERGAGNLGLTPILSTITAIDFNALMDRRYFTGTLTGGTLKSMLETLDDYLTDYGVALDAAQVNGPTLDTIDYPTAVPLADVFSQLESLSEYLRDISYYKYLRMWATGSQTAPFNVTSGDQAKGDVIVESSRVSAGAAYANRVVVRFSGSAVAAWAFLECDANFANGETVTLGSQTYTFETVFSDTQDYVLIGADTDGSLNNLIAAITNGAGEGTVYGTGTTANASAGAYLHHTAFMKVYALTAGSAGNSIACTDTCANADWIWEGGGSTSTLAGGADEAVTEEVQANDTGEQASRGLWETVVEAPDVFSSTIAQALADAYLVQRVAQPRTVEYKTRLSGLRPGQTQTVTLSTRDLSGTWLITEIRTLGTSGTYIWRTVKATEGTTFVKDWRQVYQQWGGVS